MGASVEERPQGEAIQDARLGNGKMLVLASPAGESLATQATALFDAMTRAVATMGGWLVDEMVAASTVNGFARLMERRHEVPWEEICPSGVGSGKVKRPVQLARRTPLTMLSVLGYPCWALAGHVYSIDLFNPGNELMLPYDDPAHRLWAVYVHPPNVVLPNRCLRMSSWQLRTPSERSMGLAGSGWRKRSMHTASPSGPTINTCGRWTLR
jgi:hypothetical protein